MSIIFNEQELRDYFRSQGREIEADIAIVQNRTFEEHKLSDSDILMDVEFENKLLFDKQVCFEKDRLYRIISPIEFANFESFKLVTFSKGDIDETGNDFSVYENTKSSFLVKFNKDKIVEKFIVLINNSPLL